MEEGEGGWTDSSFEVNIAVKRRERRLKSTNKMKRESFDREG